MKRHNGLTAVCAAAIALAAGCATEKNIKAGTGWAKEYYGQPNAAEILHVEGTNICLTLSGASSLTLSTPVPTKNMIPKEATWTDGLFDTLKTVAPWVFMGWAIEQGGFGNSSSSTVNNGAAP